MKKTTLLFSIIALLSCSGFAYGQTDSTDITEEHEEAEVKAAGKAQVTAEEQFLNIPKINLLSLPFRNISLQYERILTKRMSVALGLRIMPKGGIPYAASVAKIFGDGVEGDPALKDLIDNSTISGFAITPEFRYYVGKQGYGKGFYIAPFVRYASSTLNGTFKFEEKDRTEIVNFEGNFHSFGFGFLLGSQFKISSRITLDWWILGPYWATPRMTLKGSGFNIDEESFEDFEHELKNLDLNFFTFTTTHNITRNSAEIKTSGGSPLIRGFGLCLGFRF